MFKHIADRTRRAVTHVHQRADFRFAARSLLACFLVFLIVSPARAIDCTTPPQVTGNAKLSISLDHPIVWQTRGGEVRFTINGFDPAKDNPTVVACLRWTEAPGSKEPAPAWTSLLVSRVGVTNDKTGFIFAVTVPDVGNAPANVPRTLLGIIPLAEMRILATEGAGQAAPALDTTRFIGVTSKWLSGTLAVLFALLIGVVLYVFAKRLGVPGRGVILRIISTARGWASLAQFQIILWTLVIGAGAVYVMTLTGQLIEITGGTLALLGIAGGAAIGSQLYASQQARASSMPTPPGQVTGLGAEAVDDSSITLSWQPPTGGSAPNVYAVQYRPTAAPNAASAPWSNATPGISTPRFVLVGLNPRTKYDVQVFALNDAGNGAPTIALAVATTDDPPVAPHGAPSAVIGLGQNGNPAATSMPLTWQAVPGVTYTVQYRIHDSDQRWRTAADNVATGQLIVGSLIADTTYDFRVRAQNNIGPAPWSSVLQAHSGTREPRWSDIVTDTDRAPEIDVTRVQMLFFTVISAFFVALGVANTSAIPEIPGSYVALMGISNGVYLTAKFMR